MKSFLNDLTKSKKTTISGILAAITVIIGQFMYLFDDDPTTNFSFDYVIAVIVGMYGLISARDNNVTSEEANAREN
jgi:uncharacterized membrane protein